MPTPVDDSRPAPDEATTKGRSAPREQYALNRVFQLRDNLLLRLSPFVGKLLCSSAVMNMAEVVAVSLRDYGHKGVALSVVYDSLRSMVDKLFTQDSARILAWAIAGNTKRLKKGRPLEPIRGEVWVPAQVVAMTSGRNKKGDYGRHVALRVLAGSPCPSCATAFWSQGLCWVVAKTLGFQRPRDKSGEIRLVYESPEQLYGMRLMALVSPAAGNKLRSTAIKCTAGYKKFNRELLALRYRVKQPCPRNYSHQCHRCHVGSITCPAATHKFDFVAMVCDGCGYGMADPEHATNLCSSCQTAKQARKMR